MNDDKILQQIKLKMEKARNKAVEDRLEWARKVLEEYSGPGGSSRYSTPEEAKEARKRYIRAYTTIWGKTEAGVKNRVAQENKPGRLASKRKRGRSGGKDVAEFYASRILDKEAYCAYCRVSLEPHERTVDHYLPLSKGGEHAVDNLVICCLPCNSRKGNRMPEDFIKEVCGDL